MKKKTKEYHNCSLIPTAENTPAPNTMAWRAGLAHLCLLWGWQVAAHIIFTALMMNTLALVQICGLQLLAFLTILTRNTQKARTSTTAADITKLLQLPRSCSGKNPLKFLDQGHDWHQYQNQMFFASETSCPLQKIRQDLTNKFLSAKCIQLPLSNNWWPFNT